MYACVYIHIYTHKYTYKIKLKSSWPVKVGPAFQISRLQVLPMI